MSNMASAAPPNQDTSTQKNEMQPITQQKKPTRRWAPEWVKQLPYFKLPETEPDFALVDKDSMIRLLRKDDKTPDSAIRSVAEDLDFLNREMMPLFRELDLDAKTYQNAYRLTQCWYILLAMVATILGSFLALAINQQPPIWVPIIGFLETLVALLATFIASVSNREMAFNRWLTNRRCAEGLRREYFRYVMNLAPYDAISTGVDRRRTLSRRAADIYSGKSKEQSHDDLGGTTNG